MAWIKMIDEGEAEGLLAELYDRAINREKGRVGHIVKIHSLNPKALRAVVELSRAVSYGHTGLSRAQREMIATVVSVLNGCHY